MIRNLLNNVHPAAATSANALALGVSAFAGTTWCVAAISAP
jgi:hypothetical protein